MSPPSVKTPLDSAGLEGSEKIAVESAECVNTLEKYLPVFMGACPNTVYQYLSL